jgi:hypothetical protein
LVQTSPEDSPAEFERDSNKWPEAVRLNLRIHASLQPDNGKRIIFWSRRALVLWAKYCAPPPGALWAKARMSRLQLNAEHAGSIERHEQTEQALIEQNGAPITPAERPWKCFVCSRVNDRTICMTCKASFNYNPHLEELKRRKMYRYHETRNHESVEWNCGCCKRDNPGHLEKCRICDAHNTAFRDEDTSTWWSWNKSMENAALVREEIQDLQESRYQEIQAELQGRADVARMREEARLKVIADAEKEAARKAEGERRRAEMEWKLNTKQREADAVAKAEEERKTIWNAKRRASLVVHQKDADDEMRLLRYGEFGSQDAKSAKLKRAKMIHARNKKHMQWLKEKVAKDDAKKWAKEAGQSPTATGGQSPTATGGFGAKMLLAGYSADQAHVAGAYHTTTDTAVPAVPNNNMRDNGAGRQEEKAVTNQRTQEEKAVTIQRTVANQRTRTAGEGAGRSSPATHLSVAGAVIRLPPSSRGSSPVTVQRPLTGNRSLAASAQQQLLPPPYAQYPRQHPRTPPSHAAVAVAAAAAESVSTSTLPMIQRLLASSTDHVVVSPTTVGAGMVLMNQSASNKPAGGMQRYVSPDSGFNSSRSRMGSGRANSSRMNSARITSARIDSGSTRRSRQRRALPSMR